jgi:nucleoside-diphosphate-sugar epimerase
VETHDIIIPLAAIVGMPACKKDPDLTVAVNYQQIKNIIDIIQPSQKLLVPNTNSQYGSS